MATIKHIASKSSDYSAAESYLIFQHDEYRNIPILDENGQHILRESYLIDTVECGDEDYAMACIRANKKFGVNDKTGDIKSHHYIISFDPRDSTDNGLTMEKASSHSLRNPERELLQCQKSAQTATVLCASAVTVVGSVEL